MNSDADQQLRTSESLNRVGCSSSGVPLPERRKPLVTLSLSLIQSLPRIRLGRNQVQDWVRMARASHYINVWHNIPRCRLPLIYAWGETTQGVLSKDQNLKVKSFERKFCNEVRRCETQGKKSPCYGNVIQAEPVEMQSGIPFWKRIWQ